MTTDLRGPPSPPAALRGDLPPTPTPLQQLLDDAAARWPDQIALSFMGRSTTYRELLAMANRAAKGLQQCGVRPGVHVGLYLPNTPHYVVAFFGVLKAGGTVVQYTALDGPAVLAHRIAHSATAVLVTLDLAMLYPRVAGLLDGAPLRTLVVGNLAEMSAQPPTVRAQLLAGQQLSAVPRDAQHLDFAALLDNDGRFQAHAIAPPAEHVAVLQYTGAPLAQARGVVLTHGNLSAACAQAWAMLRAATPALTAGDERMLTALAPGHIEALAILLSGVHGAARTILHTRFDTQAVLRDIVGKQVSCLWGVPAMFTALLAHPELGAYDLRGLKHCGVVGAVPAPALAQRFEAATGCRLRAVWGTPQTAGMGSVTLAHGRRRAGACGLPAPGIALRVQAPDAPDRTAKPGEPGALCVRGGNVMQGYWNDPAASAQVMTADGFVRTDTLARMGAHGDVCIVEPATELLLSAGQVVDARVVEAALCAHAQVADACVVDTAGDHRSRALKAFVVPRAGAAACTLAALQAFVHDALGPHARIEELEIRTELPRTPLGTLARSALRGDATGTPPVRA